MDIYSKKSSPEPLVLRGVSFASARLREQVEQACATSGAVLIVGERGSGRAAIARFIQARRGDGSVSGIHVSKRGTETRYHSPGWPGFRIDVPALRERPEDIPLLALCVARESSRELGKDISSLAADTVALLGAHRWPGNLRELTTMIEAAVSTETSHVLMPGSLPETLREGHPWLGVKIASLSFRDFMQTVRRRLAREYLSEIMRLNHGCVTHAAVQAGLERETLHRLLKSAGLTSDEFRVH